MRTPSARRRSLPHVRPRHPPRPAARPRPRVRRSPARRLCAGVHVDRHVRGGRSRLERRCLRGRLDRRVRGRVAVRRARPRRVLQGEPDPGHAGHAHDRHRHPGVPALLRRRRPDQRPGLRVGRGLRRGRELGFTPERGHLDGRAVQQVLRPRRQGLRLRHQPDLDHARSAQKAVDFSNGYYTVNQAVVALKDSPIADATTLAELQAAKLGAQVGTTSLDFITDVVQPAEQPYVYNDTNDAKSALKNGQIDGIVVDLPTAFYITAVEIDGQQDRRPVPGAGGRRAVRPALRQGQPAGRRA